MSQKTIDYYNENADKFTGTTQGLVFTDVQDRFVSRLDKGMYILDFGCGSGRDTKYFLDKGFKVCAVDGSTEMVKAASQFSGIEVKQMLFQELNDVNEYDGIWACSSILHCSYAELQDVFTRMIRALKDNGVLYTSFKYGTFEGERNGRYFIDMDEEKFSEFLKLFPQLMMDEYWISSDIRPGRDNEKWLNIIMRKI